MQTVSCSPPLTAAPSVFFLPASAAFNSVFFLCPSELPPWRVLPVALSSAAPWGVLRRAGPQVGGAVHMLPVSCCGPGRHPGCSGHFHGENLREYADTRSFSYPKAFSAVPARAEFSSSATSRSSAFRQSPRLREATGSQRLRTADSPEPPPGPFLGSAPGPPHRPACCVPCSRVSCSVPVRALGKGTVLIFKLPSGFQERALGRGGLWAVVSSC